MKKLFAIVLAIGIGTVMLNAQEPPRDDAASDAPSAKQDAQRPGGGPGGRRQLSPEQIRERQTKRFQEAAAELKKMYDANQDGVIDPQERAKLDADLDVAERLQRYIFQAKVINAVDEDRNLEFTEAELAKMPEAMKNVRPAMAIPPGGPRGERGQHGPRGDRGPQGARGHRSNGPRPPQPADGGADEPPAPPAED